MIFSIFPDIYFFAVKEKIQLMGFVMYVFVWLPLLLIAPVFDLSKVLENLDAQLILICLNFTIFLRRPFEQTL
jgi:hypothetical protein